MVHLHPAGLCQSVAVAVNGTTYRLHLVSRVCEDGGRGYVRPRASSVITTLGGEHLAHPLNGQLLRVSGIRGTYNLDG